MTTITESNIRQQLDLSNFEIVLPAETNAIVEYGRREDFPSTGRTKRLYVALDTGLPWRWSEAASSYALLLPVIDAGTF
jgi:hypothetical protein